MLWLWLRFWWFERELSIILDIYIYIYT